MERIKAILKNKKLIISSFAVIAVLLFTVTGTFAYIQHRTETKSNHFSSGVINITVNEEFEPEDITEEGIDKKVTVKNDSLNGQLNVADCYVRVNLTASWVNDDGSISPIDAASLIEYTINDDPDSGWIIGEDGYYYYNKILKKDEETTCLLKKVALKSGVQRPENGHLEVNVLADAVSVDKIDRAWKLTLNLIKNE